MEDFWPDALQPSGSRSKLKQIGKERRRTPTKSQQKYVILNRSDSNTGRYYFRELEKIKEWIFSSGQSSGKNITPRMQISGEAIVWKHTSSEMLVTRASYPLRLANKLVDRCLRLEDIDLWAVLNKEDSDNEVRIAALKELIERDDAQIEIFIVKELERSELNIAWRNALIMAAEDIRLLDVSLRSSLAQNLLRHAQSIRHTRDHGAEGPLWAALRRYATLVPAAGIVELKLFLQGDDRPTTKQVVFQRIYDVFSTQPPSHTSDIEQLLKRVTELAIKYLDPDWFSSPENKALALNAFCAAAALGEPQLPNLAMKMRTLQKPWLAARATDALRTLIEHWALANPQARRTIEDSITILANPVSSNTAKHAVPAFGEDQSS